jgi:phosphoglycerate dehydrogenase-like enzyme
MTARVAVLDDYQAVAETLADWSTLAATVDFLHEPIGDADAVAARLASYDVIVAMRERTPFPAEVLRRLPALRLLVTTGMRNAAIDLDAARAAGITVCGTNALVYPTAELTWALILGLCRQIARADAELRAGGWQTTVGVGLQGKTLGVVGLGRLGSQIAQIGGVFGMDVVAWSANLTAERAAEAGARLVSKDELFATSDIVTLHLVLSDRTRGVVGAAELGAMKPSAYLVNTSRGPLVVESDLVGALRERRIAGAALDVFDVEPLPADSPLRALDNVLLTPHLGYVTEENYRVYYREAVEDIAAFHGGEPLRPLT